jgi:hypothetical protein
VKRTIHICLCFSLLHRNICNLYANISLADANHFNDEFESM